MCTRQSARCVEGLRLSSISPSMTLRTCKQRDVAKNYAKHRFINRGTRHFSTKWSETRVGNFKSDRRSETSSLNVLSEKLQAETEECVNCKSRTLICELLTKLSIESHIAKFTEINKLTWNESLEEL